MSRLKRANSVLKANGAFPSGSLRRVFNRLSGLGLIETVDGVPSKQMMQRILDEKLPMLERNIGAYRALQQSKQAVQSRAFYQSWDWKKVRFKVLKEYGPACMCCGSTHRPVVDHIKPLAKYPHMALDFDNLQVLCNDCNMGKAGDDETDFRPLMEGAQ